MASFPRPRVQFLELQPAWKSATCSPARNTGLAPSPTASAARRLISSISLRTHPTLEISISPSCAIQKIVGTLVSPYAFDTGYVFVSSSKMGNVMPNRSEEHTSELQSPDHLVCRLLLEKKKKKKKYLK